MPRLNRIWRLLSFMSALILIFINVVPQYKPQVMTIIAGNETATLIFTPLIDWINQWAVLITLFVIVGLIIYGLVNYLINRGKPDKPSDEVETTRELIQEIKGLREDLAQKAKDGGGQNDK